MARYENTAKVMEIARVYLKTDTSVRDISDVFDVPYKNVWKYMRKAIDMGIITREGYVMAYNRKNSLAKINERNPNYNGKIVRRPEVRQKLSIAMSRRTISQDIRDKISNTKKNGNGMEKRLDLNLCESIF